MFFADVDGKREGNVAYHKTCRLATDGGLRNRFASGAATEGIGSHLLGVTSSGARPIWCTETQGRTACAFESSSDNNMRYVDLPPLPSGAAISTIVHVKVDISLEVSPFEKTAATRYRIVEPMSDRRTARFARIVSLARGQPARTVAALPWITLVDHAL